MKKYVVRGVSLFLVGLLVMIVLPVIAGAGDKEVMRELLEKKTEDFMILETADFLQTAYVSVVALTVPFLRLYLEVYLENEQKRIAEGKVSLRRENERRLAQEVYDDGFSSFNSLLREVLMIEYTMGYRVKFVTEDFIILERER